MTESNDHGILSSVDHRPWPLPQTRWVMTQRWNDLLFAHWPLPAAQIARLLPPGLVVDTMFLSFLVQRPNSHWTRWMI